jgi:uncharacterized metal-binding protein YceD (DUF177 family)
MDPLIQFRIPVKGLHNGPHDYSFDIDDAFFGAFEASPIQKGSIELTLSLDKRPDMLVLEFIFSGTVRTECDRCLAEIDLPVADEQRLLVKYSLEEVESDDPDVLFIHPESQQLNVAPFIYDYVLLSMPLIKAFDCENEPIRPCNQEMLDYLARQQDEAEKSTSDEDEPENNPFRDAFKDWNNLNDR